MLQLSFLNAKVYCILAQLALIGISMLLTGAWAGIDIPALSSGVSLAADLPTGQPVGTTILWRAVADESSANTRYHYRIEDSNGNLTAIRDFHASPIFAWSPINEGAYVVKVTVDNGDEAAIVAQTQTFSVISRVTDGKPVLSGTSHPLVLLYSAPPCSGGSSRVRFRPSAAMFWRYTPWVVCRPGTSTNQYVAGLLAETAYVVQHEHRRSGTTVWGPLLRQRTGPAPLDITSLLDSTFNRFDGNTSLIDEGLRVCLRGYSCSILTTGLPRPSFAILVPLPLAIQ